MVLRRSQGASDEYEVFDDRGESIGRVILSTDSRVVGRGSGTVLLLREAAPQLTPWR